MRIKRILRMLIVLIFFIPVGYSIHIGADNPNLPQITNINRLTSNPLDTNPTYGWVNISCTVKDNFAVSEAILKIYNPEGTLINKPMISRTAEKYYYRSTTAFSTVGNYSYYIWVKDSNDNICTSSTIKFSMSPNWDMDNDGSCTIHDFVLISNLYGEIGSPGWVRQDIDNNGRVQIVDLNLLGNHYGESWYSSNEIVNSRGYSWPASGENIQTAIDNLSGAGDVWLPAATFTLSSITIMHDGVKIHGQGPESTILHFTGSNFGILASENPSASGNVKFKWGLQNLEFDNFTFSGSAMWIVIRKGLVIKNVVAEDIQRGFAAIRVICPFGNDNNGDGWSDSTGHYWSGSQDAVTEDIRIINCHTIRTSSHGFALWSTDLKGILYKNILFDNCSALQGGYGSTSTGSWSVGFNFGEIWNVAHEIDEARLQNLTVRTCEAYENWESGFHIENKIRKTDIYFINCVSNNNGQKYLKTNNDGGEAWKNPYGAGFLLSYKANPNDNNMVLMNCAANGNGAWGYRGSATPYPIFIDCSGDEYPSSSQGNGRWTIPKGAPGGLSKMCGNIL
jgi:hypothetical protein